MGHVLEAPAPVAHCRTCSARSGSPRRRASSARSSASCRRRFRAASEARSSTSTSTTSSTRRISGPRTSWRRSSGSSFFLVVVDCREARRAPSAGAARMSAPESVVSLAGVTKTFAAGGVTALRRHRPRCRAGRVHLADRPVGMRQVDLAPGDRRPDPADSAGVALVNGKPAPRARLDRDYGIVFQAAVLYDWRTVAKNIALPLELLKWDQAKRNARVAEMVELVELTGFESHYPVAALGRDAAARRDRPRALVLARPPADGRAVRRPRRDDARAPESGAAPDLGRDGLDRRLRDALDLRGGLPLDARRRDVTAARPDRRGCPIDLQQPARRGDAGGSALLRARDRGTRAVACGREDGSPE